MRALAAAWLVGGMLVGVAVLPYLWRSSISSPFTWLAALGGVALVGAGVGTAVLAHRAGSSAAPAGAALVLLGYLMASFGIGLVLLPVGVLLYGLGLTGARMLTPAAVVSALGLLALAAATVWTPSNQIVGIELAVAAALLVGVRMASRR